MNNLKIPDDFGGINGEKAYHEIVNREEKKTVEEKPTTKALPVDIKEFEKYDYYFAGEEEYNKYKAFVEKKFPKEYEDKTKIQTLEELAKPELKDKIFKGSSSFINSAMNMVLRSEGAHVVTQAQLEHVRRNNKLDLSDVYSDSGICVRSNLEPNEVHAKSLVSQLGEKQNLPVYIPVISYDLEKNSSGNLEFKIIDKSKILHLPILNSNNGKFSDSDIDMKTGFPTKVSKKGARDFYTPENKQGVSRCYLFWDSNLYSGNSILPNSVDYGRVVLAKLKEGIK